MTTSAKDPLLNELHPKRRVKSSRFNVDRIAAVCLDAYESLGVKGAKPTRRSNSKLEWTILAGLVISYFLPSPSTDEQLHYVAISIATGLKCLPLEKLPVTGDVLHDCHAEVLARRGARKWLLQRLRAEISLSGSCSETQGLPFLFEKCSTTKRWSLRSGVDLHWYLSALPCGDASSCLLEFQRAQQDVEAERPTTVPPHHLLQVYTHAMDRYQATSTSPTAAASSHFNTGNAISLSRGRAGLDHLGALRTKPGRPDSPPSISMSCSDKLALWNAVGLQGTLLSHLFEPIYPTTMVLSNQALQDIFPTNSSQLAAFEKLIEFECQRALYQRLANYEAVSVHRATIRFTGLSFIDSRESVERRAKSEMASSTLTGAVWHDFEPVSCAGSILFSTSPWNGLSLKKTEPLHENLVGGTKLGAPTKRKLSNQPLKSFARSSVSKLDFFQQFRDTLIEISSSSSSSSSSHQHDHHDDSFVNVIQNPLLTYFELKHVEFESKWIQEYRKTKAKLIGERSRTKDEHSINLAISLFLDNRITAIRDNTPCDQPNVDSIQTETLPPFSPWLVTSRKFEDFDIKGQSI